jgi:PKD repeat protein
MGTLTQYPVTDARLNLQLITAGADGNIWFSAEGVDRGTIGRISPQGVITLFPEPAPGDYVSGLTTGVDGNVWFGVDGGLGLITPTGAISLTSVPIDPVQQTAPDPAGITDVAAGSDGSIWFTKEAADIIGRLLPSGQIQQFLVPFPPQPQYSVYPNTAEPWQIGFGPGGNPWIFCAATQSLAHIDLQATSGTVFALPTETAASGTEGAPYDAVLAEISDSDASIPASDLAVTIEWNDEFPQDTKPHTTTATLHSNGLSLFAVEAQVQFIHSGWFSPVMTVERVSNGMPVSEPLTINLRPILVSDAPLSSTPGLSIIVAEGSPSTDFELGTFSDPGASFVAYDYQTTGYTVTVYWGDGSFMDTGYFDTINHSYEPLNPSRVPIYGSHKFATPGVYAVYVTVSDRDKGWTSFETTVDVQGALLNAGAAPVSAVEGNQGNWEVASFDDPDASAFGANFSAQVVWSDAPPSDLNDTASVTNTGNGHFVVMDNREFDTAGVIPFTVNIGNGDLQLLHLDGTARIADAPLAGEAEEFTAYVGEKTQRVVARFTDANLTAAIWDYAVAIDWGDGQYDFGPSACAVTQVGPGSFVVTGTHVYDSAEDVHINVTISDDNDISSPDGTRASITVSSMAIVNPLIVRLTPEPITGILGDDNDWEVAAFHAADPGVTAADFSVKVLWGDDLWEELPNGSPGGPSTVHDMGNGEFVVTAEHQLYRSGFFNVDVTITTTGGLESSVDSLVQVADLPLVLEGIPVSATERQAVSGALAVFVAPYPSVGGYIAVADWGDGSTSPVAVSDGTTDLIPTAPPGAAFVVDGTHTYHHPGSYVISVTITNVYVLPQIIPQRDSATVTTTATISTAPIVVTPAPLPLAATEGASTGTQTLAEFTEADTEHIASDFSALVDWGDDSTSNGTIAEAPGSFAVQGSHVYLDPGTYTVSVVVQGNGQTSLLTEPITVAPVVVPLFGGLDPSSDSGVSSSDGITCISTPTFRGTTTPGARVLVIGSAFGGTAPLYIGQIAADASGSWSITTTHLVDGRYSFVAYAENAAGRIRNQHVLVPNGLLIETTPPSVTLSSFNIARSTVVISVVTGAAGLDVQSAMDRAGYVLKTAKNGGKRYVRPTVLVSRAPGGPMTITATFNSGHRVPATPFSLSISSQVIRDIAGNKVPATNLAIQHATPVPKTKSPDHKPLPRRVGVRP